VTANYWVTRFPLTLRYGDKVAVKELLERIKDATNVAEMVIFMVRGTDLRQQRRVK
jgi:hypothetical protein